MKHFSKNHSVEPQELDRDQQKALHIANQWRQAKGQNPVVSCECGLAAPLRFLFRCVYCGAFFCQSCAELHFGKTREQYNQERSNAKQGTKA